jgi:hypothetical protein
MNPKDQLDEIENIKFKASLCGRISQLKTCIRSTHYEYKNKIQGLTADLKFFKNELKEIEE